MTAQPFQRLLVAAICLVAAGCGKPTGPARAPVAGAVTLDGQPLPAGTIRFVPTGDTKGPAASGAIKDGAYKLPAGEGPVVGSHRVEIEATNFAGFELDDEQAYAQRAAKSQQPLPRNPIPDTYNRQSTLSATIPAEGNEQLNFPLESKGTASRR